MPRPVTQLSALTEAADYALDRRDWAALRFNASLMTKEDPTSPVALSYLGVAFLQLGLEKQQPVYVEQGLEYHREAVRLGPDHAVALGNLGLALLKLGQASQSLEILATATKLHPQDRDLLGCRAQAELDVGQLGSADRSVRRLLPLLGGRLAVFHLDRLFLGSHQVPLRRPLPVGVRQIEEGYACEENEFELYGVGSSFKAALIELCRFFVTLVDGYVNTEDQLDEGAQDLASQLREHVDPGSVVGVGHAG